jgi:hypothetical protein
VLWLLDWQIILFVNQVNRLELMYVVNHQLE